MKRKVATRRAGEKSRKGTTSTLQELFLRKSFFLDKKLEARQGREPPCSLPERYFSQKGYFLLLTLRFMTAYVTPGLVQSFGQIVRKREGHRLEEWEKQVSASGITEVQRFAKGLERDKATSAPRALKPLVRLSQEGGG